MENKSVVIIGGGPAGLTAAIHLGKKGMQVTVFEKENYPHHKVCGEYLSKEVIPYLESLEIPFNTVNPKNIQRFNYSSTKGKLLEATLPLGGLGISRYELDFLLYRTACKYNVEIRQEKVTSINFSGNHFTAKTSRRKYKAKFVLGAYGKRDSLDKELNRKFFNKPAPWIAIKSHYEKSDFPDDLVALHNFKGGYCGLSKTETGVVNVCYLATYKSFKQYRNPEAFRENILRKNPHLDRFFSEATELFDRPLSIAQVSFSRKTAVEDHIMMIGDTAGLIHPLCGNGMAMAVKSAKIASEVILENDQQEQLDRAEMEKEYERRWNREFRGRLKAGKWLQKILQKESFAEISQAVLSKMPFLLPAIIKQTHGSKTV